MKIKPVWPYAGAVDYQEVEEHSEESEWPSYDAIDYQEGGDHYKKLSIQPAEYIISNGLGFPEGNVIKYVSRHYSKNGIEDLRKARHYLELLAELVYKEKL